MTYTLEEFKAREDQIVRAGRLLEGPSLAEQFASLPVQVRKEFLLDLSTFDAYRLLYLWEFWSRPKQRAPLGEWTIWLLLSGRGFGKNRTGAEWIRHRIETGVARTICFIGPEWRDVRRYMVGGQKGPGGSGLLDVWPEYPENDPRKPRFLEQKAEIHFPAYDAVIYLNTAEQKELRGANFDTAWGDEIIKWRYAEELWHNFEMTLREPGDVPPQAVITTTPMPMQLLQDIIMDPGTHVTHGTTYENAANLAKTWLERMRRRYEGTRVGDQELGARVLGDNPDALFSQLTIDQYRVKAIPELQEIGVGVDPAVSEKRQSDETGIVGGGVDDRGHLYVIADRTEKLSPEGWAKASVDLALEIGATFFAVERNKIGDLAAHNLRIELRDRKLLGKFEIREAYAMDDKAARATPLSGHYQKGLVHHVGRLLNDLENEQTNWNPKKRRSPNRIDALTHLAYELCGFADEEPDKDPREAFQGLKKANAAMRQEPNPLLPRGRTVGSSVVVDHGGGRRL